MQPNDRLVIFKAEGGKYIDVAEYQDIPGRVLWEEADAIMDAASESFMAIEDLLTQLQATGWVIKEVPFETIYRN